MVERFNHAVPDRAVAFFKQTGALAEVAAA
jgi:hypothetical protein